MKTQLRLLVIFLLLLALSIPAFAQGTAFTYQGFLNANGGLANGFFDFEFSLYTNAAGSGNQVGATLTSLDVGVTNGLFMTTLDFGGVFTGNPTWLSISVRSNGTVTFTALTPLQPLTPVPYSIYAANAGAVAGSNVSGTIANSSLPSNPNFSGTVTGTSFSGNGSTLTSLNASNISSGTVADARLSTNVDLLNANQTLTGVKTISGPTGPTMLTVQGNTTGGFGGPTMLVQNNSTGANAGPALRMIGTGNSPNGVLSVSSEGTGLLAQFGNSNAFVAQLDTNGNWTANSYTGIGSNLTSVNASTLGGTEVSSTTGLDGVGFGTNVYLRAHPLYLRGDQGDGDDHNHGLAYAGNGVTNFANTNVQPDGPVLWGFTGGALAQMSGGAAAALTWNNAGVNVSNALNVGGVVTAGGFSGNGAQLTNVSIPSTTINNTVTNPVPVISAAGDTPFVEQVSVAFGPGTNQANGTHNIGQGLTVPTGKTLVIEEVSAYLEQSDSGDTLSPLLSLTCNGYILYYSCGMWQPNSNVNLPGFAAQIKHYADPGSTIIVTVDRTITTGNLTIIFQLSGYLINAPP